MALAFSVLYSVTDAKGEVATTEVNVPSTLTLANLTGFANDMAQLIDDMITGAISRIGLVVSIALPAGIKVAPLGGADVEEGAKFQFRTAGGFYTGLRIPTFDEALINPNSRAVDVDDPLVLAFLNAMRTGITVGGGPIQPTDKREDDIVSLKFAKEQFLSSRA
jgi:hypothetical protein